MVTDWDSVSLSGHYQTYIALTIVQPSVVTPERLLMNDLCYPIGCGSMAPL